MTSSENVNNTLSPIQASPHITGQTLRFVVCGLCRWLYKRVKEKNYERSTIICLWLLNILLAFSNLLLCVWFHANKGQRIKRIEVSKYAVHGKRGMLM